MRIAVLALVAALAAPGALAQRDAISAELSPEAAAKIFEKAVVEGCVAAVTSGGGVSALPLVRQGRLQPTNDPEMRRQSGAGPDETVWDVMDGRGVVTLREKPGRCVVSGYGLAAATTIASVAQALVGPPGFQRLAAPVTPANGLGQTLSFSSNGRAVIVQLTGSEPGMPGHQSRFSVVTATVFIPAR